VWPPASGAVFRRQRATGDPRFEQLISVACLAPSVVLVWVTCGPCHLCQWQLSARRCQGPRSKETTIVNRVCRAGS
jgi:hypothetical protein